jgi:stage II sporulation protein D
VRTVLRGRLPVAVLVAVAVVGAVLVAYARQGGAAGAEETYPTPASGVFTLAGHGNGHGHGLSQYGAANRARAGQSAAQILAFYYPGTAAGSVPVRGPDGLIRIRLTLGGEWLTVAGAPKLVITDIASGAAMNLSVDPAVRYQVRVSGAAVTLWSATGSGAFTPVTLPGGGTSTVGPLVFAGPALLHLVRDDATARDYAGTLSGAPGDGGALRVVNEVSIDDYVAGVVPAEVFPSWPAATLQAQAVAARTFAAFERQSRPDFWYHTCDTAACQAYGGRYRYAADGTRMDLQPASVLAAVAATAGQVRTAGGSLAFTQFSASNGGWTVADPAHPYLAAAADPYDLTDNPHANWTATLPAATLAGCFLPAGSVVDRLLVTGRDGHGDWHGRVIAVRVEGHSAAGAAVSGTGDGDALRRCAGVRSTYFTVTSTVRLASEPAGVRGARGNIDLFAGGPSGEVLHRRYVVNQGWQPWSSLGGSLLGSPGVLQLPDGSTRVYIRGSNNGLYEGKVDAAGAFRGWSTPRAGGVTSRPYPVRLPDGSVQVYYLSGATLRYAAFNAADAITGTFNLGGALLPGVAPAAAVTGAGAVTVFAATAPATGVPGGTLASRSLAGGRWSGWSLLGGGTAADIGAASPGAGVVDLYVRGTGAAALYTRRATNGRWGGWTNTGGVLGTGVFAVAYGAREDIWTVGTNTVAYVRTRTAAGLGGWYPIP